jgi:hypothetical protein
VYQPVDIPVDNLGTGCVRSREYLTLTVGFKGNAETFEEFNSAVCRGLYTITSRLSTSWRYGLLARTCCSPSRGASFGVSDAGEFTVEIFGAGVRELVDPLVQSALGDDPSTAELHGGDVSGSDELVGAAERE